jgi:cation diffusion facilitator CzcD-associated flavoprotein CzcO
MTTVPNKPTVAIVGAGTGGIAMGIQLVHGGYDFTIFDRGVQTRWPVAAYATLRSVEEKDRGRGDYHT